MDDLLFVTRFNIGFGSPRQDVCSTCLQLKEKIKVEKNGSEKVRLMTELRIHKLRAKAFFKLLQKEEENEILAFFSDSQKIVLTVRKIYHCPKYPINPFITHDSCTYIILPS